MPVDHTLRGEAVRPGRLAPKAFTPSPTILSRWVSPAPQGLILQNDLLPLLPTPSHRSCSLQHISGSK